MVEKDNYRQLMMNRLRFESILQIKNFYDITCAKFAVFLAALRVDLRRTRT